MHHTARPTGPKFSKIRRLLSTQERFIIPRTIRKNMQAGLQILCKFENPQLVSCISDDMSIKLSRILHRNASLY